MSTAGKAPAATRPAIRLTGLTKRFGDFTALDSIDLEVADGEFFTLLGPSGSGKTTTLRLIAGFEEPTEGTIELMGQDIEGRPPFERDVNTVFQDYALFPHMSVLDNVAYSQKVAGVGRSERRAAAERALDTVRLGGLGSRRPAQLSGGQRQRVALARAIVAKPTVLLLDEPLGALDLKLREEMQVELSSIQRELGITFIYVTHDQDEALGMSDRLAVFNEGRIEQVGTPLEVYCHPASEFVSGFVGISNVLEVDGRRFTVRPERVTLSPAGGEAAPGRTSREGTIIDRRFGGQSTRWTIDLGDGETLVVVEQNAGEDDSTQPVIGDRVAASWATGSEIPLPAAANPEEENSR